MMLTRKDLLRTWYSPKVLARSRTDVVDEDRDGVWWVHTAQGRRYRVQVTVTEEKIYVTCSCTNGQKLGDWPKCHHAAAVMAALLERDDE